MGKYYSYAEWKTHPSDDLQDNYTFDEHETLKEAQDVVDMLLSDGVMGDVPIAAWVSTVKRLKPLDNLQEIIDGKLCANATHINEFGAYMDVNYGLQPVTFYGDKTEYAINFTRDSDLKGIRSLDDIQKILTQATLIKELTAAIEQAGPWLSAAQECPNTCDECKNAFLKLLEAAANND